MMRSGSVIQAGILLIGMVICLNVKTVTGQTGIDKPRYEIVTHRAGSYLGTFNIELFPLVAPLHVNNFDSLVSEQFYDSTAFHRVVPGFVIQGGDPNSISGPISTWGQGQPWQPTVPAEFNPIRHVRGILGAARAANPNSATSQFYITVDNAFFLDNNYTVYGKVTSGMDVVDTIVASPRDANDVPLQKIEMFVTYTGVNDTVPTAPVLVSPADASTGIQNIQTFICAAVDDAVLYEFEFSKDPSFNTIDTLIISGANAASWNAMEGNTIYYWRVTANNGGHRSVPSGSWSFTSAPGAANLIYPAYGASGIPLDPVFTWEPGAGATEYTLQVSVSNIFTSGNMVYNQSGIVDTFQQVTGLLPNKDYYWRVRSADGTSQGFYSAKNIFTTGNPTGITEADSQLTISLYPNPAKTRISLEMNSAMEAECRIDIFDLSGRTLLKNSEWIMTGENMIEMSVDELHSGSYYITVRANDFLYRIPFTVIR
jgi:peptidyl-prolyl cis-trans isomerase B (cyclophilin B)